MQGKLCPQLTPEIKKHLNETDQPLWKSREMKKRVDLSNYKRKRSKVNSLRRKAKSSYSNKLLKENASKPDKFWKTIRQSIPFKIKTKHTRAPFRYTWLKNKPQN